MGKKEKKIKKQSEEVVTKKSKKEDKVSKKSKKSDKKASKKKDKKFVVPEVLRSESMAAVVQHSILNDSDSSDKVKALPKKDLRYLVDLINATTLGHLENGGKVQFMPYYTLEPKARLPRTGRNPKTGEALKIKGSRYVSFRSGKGLKELMNRDEAKVKKAVDAYRKVREEREAKAAERAKATKKKKKVA